jgi:hypothetical protein
MGGVVSSIFGAASGGTQTGPPPPPAAPPPIPPRYNQPTEISGATPMASAAARAVGGGMSDNIITGPQGLKQKQSTSTKDLLGA